MLISIHDYSFSYPDNQPALSHVNLDLAQGSFTVLFGRSGSGKTTLLRQLKRVLLPSGTSTGNITWQNQPLAALDNRAQASKIGYVNQHADAQFATDKVWHELAFGLESLGVRPTAMRTRIAEMATFFGIGALLDRDVRSLSGGQKQLVSLASVMTLRPELLLLDEPTAQLDPLAKQTFIQILVRLHNELGTTILLAEHELEDILPWADQLVMMRAGTIAAAGTPRAVAAKLHAAGDPLFAALPTATRLYCTGTALIKTEAIPLTVGAGRSWLAQLPLTPAPLSAPVAPAPTTPFLTAKHLAFRFAPDEADVLTDVNLTVQQGSWYGIIGNNGAGKSTLLTLLSGIRQPTSGKVTLAGNKLTHYKEADLYHEFLAVLPQDPTTLFASATVQAELLATANMVHPAMGAAAAVSGAVDLCHLRPLLDHHPFDLSGGEQQLLALAKVILLRPKILLLDEPTKGLDAFTKQQVGTILNQLQKNGVTLVMVTHDLDFIAEHADHIGLLFDGTIVADAPTHDFFAANSFYTTTASRIGRDIWPGAITFKEVAACLKHSQNS